MTPLQDAIARIEKARLAYDPKQIVHIVAASKYATARQLEELYNDGQRAFGENKVQDLVEKATALESLPIEWHFIGRLQTNKINALLSVRPALIHSIDSLSTAAEVNSRAARDGIVQKVLLQINSANEPQKAGVSPHQAAEIYEQIAKTCPALKLQGVMTIGAHTEDGDIVKRSFETTHKIFETLKPQGASICSMGMSGDFELAISCGSNLVRLGSILFK